MSSGVESRTTGSTAMWSTLDLIDDGEVAIAVNVRLPAGDAGGASRSDGPAAALNPGHESAPAAVPGPFLLRAVWGGVPACVTGDGQEVNGTQMCVSVESFLPWRP